MRLAIIRQTNKKTGFTYVIDSESYRDKEKHVNFATNYT